MADLGAAASKTASGPARAFFGPRLDFICMGGGSLIALPLIGAVIPNTAPNQLYVAVLLVALIVNFPHFIHSYQVFYGSFGEILRAPGVDPALRRRYVRSGLLVPALLVGVLALAIGAKQPDLLRYSANAMAFFVGWHYVKQGYGMLMADAALKRSFFSDAAKRCLQFNAYVCWAMSWLTINHALSEVQFLDLRYYTFDVPGEALIAAAMALACSSMWALTVLIIHAHKHGRDFPINGAVAYAASLYIWLFAHHDPEVLAFIPAFHSLQYLYMIWRYRLNVEAAQPDAAMPLPSIGGRLPISRAHGRFAGYVGCAVIFGIVAFLLLPAMLDLYVPYDRAMFGDRLFMVAIWIFINIHHYFIDNAMWRRDNPHTLKHLFAAR